MSSSHLSLLSSYDGQVRSVDLDPHVDMYCVRPAATVILYMMAVMHIRVLQHSPHEFRFVLRLYDT